MSSPAGRPTRSTARLINEPDVDAWRQRLAVLLDGLDLTDRDARGHAVGLVYEASTETSARGLRRLVVMLGGRCSSPLRLDLVAALVTAWEALPPERRRAPAAGVAERRDAAEDVSDLAGLYSAAVGSSGEADALRRLRAAVAALVEVDR